MKIKFIDNGHKEFFINMQEKCKVWDVYYKSLFYVLGICPDCRTHINNLFDFKENVIRPEGLIGGWHTSGSQYTVKLAFNLFNAFTGDVDEASKNAADYSPCNIFCCNYAPYFFEGIKIRYPEYVKDDNYQIVDDKGNVVQESIPGKILANSYVKIYEKQDGGTYKVEPMPDIVMDI